MGSFKILLMNLFLAKFESRGAKGCMVIGKTEKGIPQVGSRATVQIGREADRYILTRFNRIWERYPSIQVRNSTLMASTDDTVET